MARRGALGTAAAIILAVGALLLVVLRPDLWDQRSGTPVPVVTLPGASLDDVRDAAEAVARAAEAPSPPPAPDPTAASGYLHGNGAPLVEVMHVTALSHLAAGTPDEESCARSAARLEGRMQPANADQLAAAVPDEALAEAFVMERRALAAALGACDITSLETLWASVGTVEIRLDEIGYRP